MFDDLLQYNVGFCIQRSSLVIYGEVVLIVWDATVVTVAVVGECMNRLPGRKKWPLLEVLRYNG